MDEKTQSKKLALEEEGIWLKSYLSNLDFIQSSLARAAETLRCTKVFLENEEWRRRAGQSATLAEPLGLLLSNLSIANTQSLCFISASIEMLAERVAKLLKVE